MVVSSLIAKKNARPWWDEADVQTKSTQVDQLLLASTGGLISASVDRNNLILV